MQRHRPMHCCSRRMLKDDGPRIRQIDLEIVTHDWSESRRIECRYISILILVLCTLSLLRSLVVPVFVIQLSIYQPDGWRLKHCGLDPINRRKVLWSWSTESRRKCLPFRCLVQSHNVPYVWHPIITHFRYLSSHNPRHPLRLYVIARSSYTFDPPCHPSAHFRFSGQHFHTQRHVQIANFVDPSEAKNRCRLFKN